jgi:hypothetical protein
MLRTLCARSIAFRPIRQNLSRYGGKKAPALRFLREVVNDSNSGSQTRFI